MLKCRELCRGQRVAVFNWRERSFVTAVEPIRLEIGPQLCTGSVHSEEENCNSISERNHGEQGQYYVRSNEACEKHDGGSKAT